MLLTEEELHIKNQEIANLREQLNEKIVEKNHAEHVRYQSLLAEGAGAGKYEILKKNILDNAEAINGQSEALHKMTSGIDFGSMMGVSSHSDGCAFTQELLEVLKEYCEKEQVKVTQKICFNLDWETLKVTNLERNSLHEDRMNNANNFGMLLNVIDAGNNKLGSDHKHTMRNKWTNEETKQYAELRDSELHCDTIRRGFRMKPGADIKAFIRHELDTLLERYPLFILHHASITSGEYYNLDMRGIFKTQRDIDYKMDQLKQLL